MGDCYWNSIVLQSSIMLPSLLFVGNLTIAFIFTSLPLSFSTSVSGCGCGFGFEQQYWWIDEFGEKTDRRIRIPLFTSLL